MSEQVSICSIAPYLVPADPQPDGWCALRPNTLVRLETDAGMVGWGECYVSAGHEDAICSMVDALGARLVGSRVSDIRAFTHRAQVEYSNYFVSMDVASATSGIELAMWDAWGKLLERPVHQLLGGSCHQKFPVYANMWTERLWSAEDTAQKAKDYVSQGFNTVKFYPLWHTQSDKECIRLVERVRDAIGPDAGLAIDFVRRVRPDRLREICRRLEPVNLAWVEDPVPPYQPDALRWIRDHIRQPLLSGESVGYTHGFRDLLQKSALDYINSDICLAGGLLEMRDIAAMAAVHGVDVSPHNYNSLTVGLSASAAFAAGIPNLALIEYFPEHATKLDHVCTGRLEPRSGQLSLPDKPGWGLSFDEDLMKEFAWH